MEKKWHSPAREILLRSLQQLELSKPAQPVLASKIWYIQWTVPKRMHTRRKPKELV